MRERKFNKCERTSCALVPELDRVGVPCKCTPMTPLPDHEVTTTSTTSKSSHKVVYAAIVWFSKSSGRLSRVKATCMHFHYV